MKIVKTLFFYVKFVPFKRFLAIYMYTHVFLSEKRNKRIFICFLCVFSESTFLPNSLHSQIYITVHSYTKFNMHRWKPFLWSFPKKISTSSNHVDMLYSYITNVFGHAKQHLRHRYLLCWVLVRTSCCLTTFPYHVR